MGITPTLRCPCGERLLRPAAVYDSPPAGETRFQLGSAGYTRAYRSCAACEHWFGHHDLDLARLYDREYVDATYGGVEGMRCRFTMLMALPHERSDNRARVARLLAFAQQRGVSGNAAGRPRVLDVGAGLGVFPAAMAEAGWLPVALEPDPRTVDHLRTVAGIEALSLDLRHVRVDEHGRFDAITFNKVLEHVEDPAPLLAAASRLTSSRGFVYVEVPDVAAAAEGHGREEFFIEHHHVFSAASLAMLAERSGLSVAVVERLREPSGKFTLRLFAVSA